MFASDIIVKSIASHEPRIVNSRRQVEHKFENGETPSNPDSVRDLVFPFNGVWLIDAARKSRLDGVSPYRLIFPLYSSFSNSAVLA